MEVAENLLEQGGLVRNREVIAIVAGTRTKSGSTNFLRLHVMGEDKQEGLRFFAPHVEELVPEEIIPVAKRKRPAPRPARKAR